MTPAYTVGPVACLIAPLIAGAWADQRWQAQRLFAWISLIGAVLLYIGFQSLLMDASPWWFLSMLMLSSILSAPMWSLLTRIALEHLTHGERQFPLYRVGGTLGWMAAGLITSYFLHADSSPIAGIASAVSRVILTLCAFALPATMPAGKPKSWRSAFGLDAFSLFKERDHFTFFLVTGLYSIPLMAFYMYTPKHLIMLGDPMPTATMTIAQWSEIGAMLLVSYVMTRWKVKTLLMVSLGLSVLRYVFFAIAGIQSSTAWMIAGISLHGILYTFYFITAQIFLDRRVGSGLRTQAQGLVTLMSGGVGSLLGTLLAGMLYKVSVEQGHGGWQTFWGILAGIIVVCMLIFQRFYQGLSATPAPATATGETPKP